jgi:tetratricopeptide (TPR) repeat protein
MEKEIIKDFRLLISSNSSEAYRYYMYGNQAFYKYDYPAATEWYRKAIGIDSSFTEAIRMLSFSLAHQGLNEESRKWMLRNYEKRDQMSDLERLWAEIMHAETSDEVIKYFKLLIAYDEEMPVPHSNLAFYYLELKLYDKAITEFEKELEIYKKWGSKPRWSAVYTSLGYAYHMTGQYKKEKKLYMKGLKDFPDDPYFKQSILAFTLGKTNEANKYVEKSKSIRKNKGESEADIVADMTQEYFQYGMLDQAKEYCRELLSLRPVNPDLLNLTAHRLLNDNRTLNEVLELAERVLTLNPEDHIALHRKGWALYKLGRYDEALELMLKSRDIRVEKNLYDQEFYLHLDSVKSAVARQKNN